MNTITTRAHSYKHVTSSQNPRLNQMSSISVPSTVAHTPGGDDPYPWDRAAPPPGHEPSAG